MIFLLNLVKYFVSSVVVRIRSAVSSDDVGHCLCHIVSHAYPVCQISIPSTSHKSMILFIVIMIMITMTKKMSMTTTKLRPTTMLLADCTGCVLHWSEADSPISKSKLRDMIFPRSVEAVSMKSMLWEELPICTLFWVDMIGIVWPKIVFEVKGMLKTL